MASFESASISALLQFQRTRPSIEKLQPGVTMVIMYCTQPSPIFEKISESGIVRKSDMLAMMDPQLKKFIQNEGIILTTWWELMERRAKVK